jgi:hypothetical protein
MDRENGNAMAPVWMAHEHPEPYTPLPFFAERALDALRELVHADPRLERALTVADELEQAVALARLCLDTDDAAPSLLRSIAALAAEGAPGGSAAPTGESTASAHDGGDVPPPWQALFSRAPLVDLLAGWTYATSGDLEPIEEVGPSIVNRLWEVARAVEAATVAVAAPVAPGDTRMLDAIVSACLDPNCSLGEACENPLHGASRAGAFATSASSLLTAWTAGNPIAALLRAKRKSCERLTRSIESIDPDLAALHTTVRIRATDDGFGDEAPSHVCLVGQDGQTQFPMSSWSDRQIEIAVEDGAPSGAIFFAPSIEVPAYRKASDEWRSQLPEWMHTVLAATRHYPPRRLDPLDECQGETRTKRTLLVAARPYVADAHLEIGGGVRLEDLARQAAPSGSIVASWRVEQAAPDTRVALASEETVIADGLPPTGSLSLPPPYDTPVGAAGIEVRISAGGGGRTVPAGGYARGGPVSTPVLPGGPSRFGTLVANPPLVTLTVPSSQDHRGAGSPAVALVGVRFAGARRAQATIEATTDTDLLSVIGPDTPVAAAEPEFYVAIQAWAYDRDRPGQPCGTVSITAGDGHLVYQAEIEVWVAPSGGKWELVGDAEGGDGHQAHGDRDFDGSNLPGRIPGARTATVAIHNVLLDNGQQLFFSPPRDDIGHQEGVETERWDPETFASLGPAPDPPATDRSRNIFCAGQLQLADGRVLVAGGHAVWPAVNYRSTDWSLRIYDPGAPPSTSSWSRLPDMTEPRWYPTLLMLPDGRVLICSGSSAGPYAPVDINGEILATVGWAGDTPSLPPLIRFSGGTATSVDVFDPAANGISRFPHADFLDCWADTYPHMALLPSGPGYDDGAILVVERDNLHLFSYQPHATDSPLGDRTTHKLAFPARRTFPKYGSGVLLPLQADGSGPIRYMVVGGGDERGNVIDEFAEATDTAEILDFDRTLSLDRQAHPGLHRTFRLAHRRFMSDAVLLADGTVLIAGGARRGITNVNHEPVRQAELFDPDSENCRPVDTATVPRTYHSTHVLLPNGTVQATGSTGGYPPGPVNNQFRVEVYRPRYLWAGPRPRITAAPGAVLHGASFVVNTPDAGRVTHAALIRAGAVTHANNMSQRYVICPPVGVAVSDPPRDTDNVRFAGPVDATVLPPGPYMLVLVDTRGVPSAARFVRVD